MHTPRITTKVSAVLFLLLSVAGAAIGTDEAIRLRGRQEVSLSTGGTTSDQSVTTTTPVGTSTPPSSTVVSSTSTPAVTSISETPPASTTTSRSTTAFSTDPFSSQEVVSSTTTNADVSSITSAADVSSQGSSTVPSDSTGPSTTPDDASSTITDGPMPTTFADGTIGTITRGAVTTETTMVIVTDAGGNTMASILTTVVTHTGTAASPSSTGDPNLSSNGTNSSSSGLTPSARNTIIGVVVGVGGAILLAGIGYVCWRLWGNKKNGAEEDDDLMGHQHAANDMSTTGAGTGQSPFKSTLDQYHNPTGQVNTSSNF